MFNPVGNLVLSGSKDATLKFWDLARFSVVFVVFEGLNLFLFKVGCVSRRLAVKQRLAQSTSTRPATKFVKKETFKKRQLNFKYFEGIAGNTEQHKSAF
jgi:WD40 repeat protein